MEQSLVEMREAVRETASGFGEQDAESAMALLNLALIARNGGHLREAGAAMEKAIAISDTRTLPAADRTQLLRSAAVLDLDLGHYDTAEMRLTDLLSHTKNRTERTLQFRLLANSLLAQGEPAAALNAADTAIALAGSDKIDAQLLFARQVHAQALALAGRSQESLAEIQAVIEGLHEVGRSESSPEAFRARRIRAEILLRAGRAADAFDELNSLSTQLRVAPKSHELELGQTSTYWAARCANSIALPRQCRCTIRLACSSKNNCRPVTLFWIEMRSIKRLHPTIGVRFWSRASG